MEQFEQLGLTKETLEILKEMGFKKPSEIQKQAIPLVLEGRDIIASSATGSGKTLAFASPIIENLTQEDYPQALILTPTRELAEQVAESVKKFSGKRLEVIPVYGGVDISGQIRQIRGADVIVGTPGRILDHLERRTLNLNKIKILVLDEFDRMLDMGFAKDVGNIIKQCPKERQTMLFSATLSPDVDYLAKQYTQNPVEVSVETFVDHSKLKQFYYDVPTNLKFSLLVHLLKNEDSDLIMIFCGTRRNADFVVNNLNNISINAVAIHGGLDQKKRLKIMNEFNYGKVNILVCTDVAARGLDIKGVSHIYNYDLPSSADDYVHRIGRTARAGKEGKAINLLAERDYENFTNILRRKDFEIKAMDVPDLPFIKFKREFRNNRSDNFRGRDNRNFSSRRSSDERSNFGRKSNDNRNKWNTRRRY